MAKGMNSIFIIFSGLKNSGKDTAAELVRKDEDIARLIDDVIGDGSYFIFTKMSFADPLRNVFSELVPEETWAKMLKDKEKSFGHPSYRESMLESASLFRKLCGEDVFVRFMEKEVGNMQKAYNLLGCTLVFVIPDARFPEEFDYLKSLPDKKIFIKTQRKPVKFISEKDEKAETYDPGIHFNILENTGSKAVLKKRLMEILEKELSGKVL
jgi:hypothetical protein